jgi:YhcH/YjgK/YiaL family protein
MIIDTLSNAQKYFCLHPLFSKAFDHIKSINLEAIEPGNYEIDGNRLRSLVFNKQGMTVAESAAKFECHNKYIDIQLCIKGSEQIGWRTRNTCSQPQGEFNVEKDFMFYKDAPDMYFQLTDNQFVILFPEDVHAPMIGEGIIKKLVIKVKI